MPAETNRTDNTYWLVPWKHGLMGVRAEVSIISTLGGNHKTPQNFLVLTLLTCFFGEGCILDGLKNHSAKSVDLPVDFLMTSVYSNFPAA